jgi:L,D-transpeptidase YbiS
VVFLQLHIPTQKLYLLQDNQIIREYKISTAKNGVGEKKGSEQTPRGWHIIRAKIGNEQPVNSVFVGRRSTGEIYSSELKQRYLDRDWILTRILWLSGLEIGKNRLGEVDTMQRYIYIHGTPDENQMGIPASHGCVRMRNDDVIELFNKVNVGSKVLILS